MSALLLLSFNCYNLGMPPVGEYFAIGEALFLSSLLIVAVIDDCKDRCWSGEAPRSLLFSDIGVEMSGLNLDFIWNLLIF